MKAGYAVLAAGLAVSYALSAHTTGDGWAIALACLWSASSAFVLRDALPARKDRDRE